MNSDVAHQVATRRADPVQYSIPPEGHLRCWRCSTYKPKACMTFGGRCWDCQHATIRVAGARTAIEFLTAGRYPAALVTRALSVDAQARAEGIELPRHQTVVRHAHRAVLRDSLLSLDRISEAVTT